MKVVVLAATAALLGFSGAAPADAKGGANLEKQCKRMLQRQLGVEPQSAGGKGRRGKAGGGASVYYTQIQNCVANGGSL